jgi:hypothetical protein
VNASLPILDTSVWGPSLWKALHVAAVCSTSRTSSHMWANLLHALRESIPCPDCSAHYNAWYNSNPLRPMSLLPIRKPVSVALWLHDLHNDVNRRTGKPTWSYAQSVSANGRDQLSAAKAAAASLQGKIGHTALSALHALLKSC